MAWFGQHNRRHHPGFGPLFNEPLGHHLGFAGNRLHGHQDPAMGFLSRGRPPFRGDPAYRVAPRERDGARNATFANFNRNQIARMMMSPVRRPPFAISSPEYYHQEPFGRGRALGFRPRPQLPRGFRGMEALARRPLFDDEDEDDYIFCPRRRLRRLLPIDFEEEDYFDDCDPDPEYEEEEEEIYFNEGLAPHLRGRRMFC